MVNIQRVGQRVMTIGNPGIQVVHPRGGAAPGWWVVPGKTCVAAYQPKGAASYAASKVNLANPGTYDATEGVAPAWDASTGWTFNGTTQFLDTGVVPLNTYSMIVRFSEVSTSGAGSILAGEGTSASSAAFAVNPILFTTAYFINGSAFGNIGSVQNSGTIALCYDQPYQNGVDKGTVTVGAIAAYTIYIGAMHRVLLPDYMWGGKVQALALYDSQLSGAEVSALHAAMMAL